MSIQSELDKVCIVFYQNLDCLRNFVAKDFPLW